MSNRPQVPAEIVRGALEYLKGETSLHELSVHVGAAFAAEAPRRVLSLSLAMLFELGVAAALQFPEEFSRLQAYDEQHDA